MAQCMISVYRWQIGFHHQLAPSSPSPSSSHNNALQSMQTLSSIAARAFLSRTGWEEVVLLPRFPSEPSNSDKPSSSPASISPSITLFRDDDLPLSVENDGVAFNSRSGVEIRYSPWAMSMMNGMGKIDRHGWKESTGGPNGGSKGGDDDGGDGGGGGGGDEDGEHRVFLLPLLTIAFAAFHLGYCIAVWMKDDSVDMDFLRTGLGLFCLLVVAAIRINFQTGIDAYLLGLGASVGVMFWTGERCLAKKEGNPAGIVALFAASMAVMFSAALYHNFW